MVVMVTQKAITSKSMHGPGYPHGYYANRASAKGERRTIPDCHHTQAFKFSGVGYVVRKRRAGQYSKAGTSSVCVDARRRSGAALCETKSKP